MNAHPRLLEINTALWLYELSQHYGRKLALGQVPPEQWDRITHPGFDYVWLMGVWKRSRAGYDIFREEPDYPPFQAHLDSVLPDGTDEDIIYSPYSIASYEPDPIVGTWNDIDKAREELRKRGVGLILDFVPNHTSPDHPWVYDKPDFYFMGTEADFASNPELYSRVSVEAGTLYIMRGKDPYFAPWSDTAQLNYFNPELRISLISELKKIARHCDGVRCDMAMLVLNDIFRNGWEWALKDESIDDQKQEFWADVRKSIPDLLLIAEAYWDTEWRLQQLGFDYVYDKRLYDRLRNSQAAEVAMHLSADLAYQSKLVRFIENHDEPRSASVFDTGRLHASAILFSTLPGMKLSHQGQMEGKEIQIPVQLRRAPEETVNKTTMSLYEKLLKITSHNAFSTGTWKLMEVLQDGNRSHSELIAYTWKLKNTIKLIVVNFGPGHSEGRIPLHSILTPDFNYTIHDELNDQENTQDGAELAISGLHVILEGYHAHIFNITISPPITS